MKQRKIVRKYAPAAQPGFLGAGHTARAVIQVDYKQSDPFIVLMDDMLDKQDSEPAGGPHPHAGFETVSLLLEGEMGDEAHRMKGGDLQQMTAGSGIIHTETIETNARMRLLQLWLNLPKEKRWVQPRVQDLPFEHTPVVNTAGAEIRVYSGSFAGLTSPLENYTPLLIADIRLVEGIGTSQVLPANYTGFIYVLDGEVSIGEPATLLKQDEVGWLDRDDMPGDSGISFRAGAAGARFILYAGEPQGDPIISHGPFIGDTQDDIHRLYSDYRRKKMQHISTVAPSQRILL